MFYTANPNCLRQQTQASCNCSTCSTSTSSPNYSGYSCQGNSIDQYPIAMAYVPWQQIGKLYEPDKGFHCGTIFPELNLSFQYASPVCMNQVRMQMQRGGRL